MAVQEQTPYIKYIANGVTQTFATEFDCESKDQLVVMLNGEEPVFTSWSYADKQVTFLIAPVVDTVVELKRQSKLNRTTDYQSYNNSFRPPAVNNDFDRIWYAIQEQNYKTGQYDFDYSYAVNTSNQALSNAATAQQRADDAYNLADTINTEIRDIERGGTGADNAADARTNLEVYSKTETSTTITNATKQATESISGQAKIATTAIAQAGTNDTDIITAKKLRNALNAEGGAPIFACRAWVNFNGTGVVAIRGSGNVLTITDTGTGDYTVSFLVALWDANYAVTFGASDGASGTATPKVLTSSNSTTAPYLKSQSGVRIGHVSSTDTYDFSVAVFR